MNFSFCCGCCVCNIHSEKKTNFFFKISTKFKFKKKNPFIKKPNPKSPSKQKK